MKAYREDGKLVIEIDEDAPRRIVPPAKDKEAQMRRDLADCQAHKARLAAAKEKRSRKNAKRAAEAKKVGAGRTAPEGHNDKA